MQQKTKQRMQIKFQPKNLKQNEIIWNHFDSNHNTTVRVEFKKTNLSEQQINKSYIIQITY